MKPTTARFSGMGLPGEGRAALQLHPYQPRFRLKDDRMVVDAQKPPILIIL